MKKTNKNVSLTSICWFSNSYSLEILAFGQLKFWLTTEHQILQHSEIFHIFCNKKYIRLVSLLTPRSILAQLFMPVINVAWTLHQAGRCCLQKCPGNGVTASAMAERGAGSYRGCCKQQHHSTGWCSLLQPVWNETCQNPTWNNTQMWGKHSGWVLHKRYRFNLMKQNPMAFTA